MASSLRGVVFQYRGAANRVSVVGSFNHWSPSAHPLRQTEDLWEITVFLPPGSYPYAFDVDGVVVPDPDPRRSPGPHGSRYSVVVVPGPARPARVA